MKKKQRAQVDYVIVGGVTGILAFGSNGEFYMLEEDEMEHGLRIIVDRTAGRVPVYFGIGAINAKKCCRMKRCAAHCRALPRRGGCFWQPRARLPGRWPMLP